MKIYISHSIRGKWGVNATDEQMQENNNKAIGFVTDLRRIFPHINFYCPGEHDEFVLIAYRKKILTEKQILDIDCAIIDSCNSLLNFSPDGYISSGMKVENDYATMSGIPIITMANAESPTEVQKLHRILESLRR